MFAKKYRYPLRQDRSFFQRARRTSQANFTVFTVPSVTHAQAAIVVPKKNFPTAVARNYQKRVWSAAITPFLTTLSPLGIVILVHRPFTDSDKEAVKKILLAL